MNETECPNHPGVAVQRRCSGCKGSFCAACVLPSPAGAFCARCEPVQQQQPAAPPSGGISKVLIICVILGVLVVACIPMIAMVAAIAIPNLIVARQAGNEAMAIGALKTIATAEAIFREGDKDNNGKLDYGTLKQLRDATLIDDVLGSGTKQGYSFTVQPGKDNEMVWWAVAKPMIPGTTGGRVFYANQEGVIYYIVERNSGTVVPMPDKDTGALPSAAIPVGR